jgi:hypothetical protein
MKKNMIWLAQFMIVLGLGSTQTYFPGSKPAEIRLISQPASPLVELMGTWPYGPCEASAIDTVRNIALIGNGETLQVLDISNPSSLSKIGEVRLEGSPQDIVLSGNYAYLVTLCYLIIVDISDQIHPSVVASLYFEGFRFHSIVLSSNHVFLASDNGLTIYDVSDPNHPVYKAHYSRELTDVAIWGNYALCVCTYWEFPKSTRSYGLEVVDISSPSVPSLIGTFELEKDYIPREIDVSADGYAYVCQSDEQNTKGKLSVIDVATNPGNPSEAGRYIISGEGLVGIAISGNYAYLIPTWPCRLVILNISNPKSPAFLGECPTYCGYGDMDSSGNLLGISHESGGFSLYNVAIPSDPVWLGNYDTPDTLSGRSNGIATRGNYVYMACMSDGLRIMDVSDPSNPKEAGACDYKRQGGGLVVSGKYAYGVDGDRLSIFDISSPRSPYRVADLDLPCASGIAVRMPYAYVSGMKSVANTTRAILTIIDISDPFEPSIVSSYVCAYKARYYGTPALSGNYVYLGLEDFSQGEDDRRSGFRVIDVSDPRNPREVYIGISSITGSYSGLVIVREDYAYLTGDMLRIFDLSNPAFPSLVVSYGLRCDGIALSGDYAYLNWDKLWIIDISNIYRSSTTGVFYQGEWGKGVAVSGNIAYVPGSLSVLKNNLAPDVSISTPSALSTLIGSVPIEVQASHDSGIEKVEFYIDDSFKAADTSAPYSYTWDARFFEVGLHTIRARAFNNNGKSSDVETEVFVVYSLVIQTDAGGTTNPAPGTYAYDPGYHAQVTAVPNTNYEFVNWTGDISSTQNPVTVTMDANKTIKANFRFIYAPIATGRKVLNRTFSQAEYINILSWVADPANQGLDIAKYRIYQIINGTPSLLVELAGNESEYYHRRAGQASIRYAIAAVTRSGREGALAEITIQ